MRILLSALLFVLAASISQAATLCADSATTGTLIQRVWEGGLNHPIYKRAGVQTLMRELEASMELDQQPLPTRGFIILRPPAGTKGLKVVGSFIAKDDRIIIQISEVQLVEQPLSSMGSVEELSYGDRPSQLNLQMGQLVAAIEGVAREYANMSATPIKILEVRALDIRSASLQKFLEESNFETGSYGGLTLLLRF